MALLLALAWILTDPRVPWTEVVRPAGAQSGLSTETNRSTYYVSADIVARVGRAEEYIGLAVNGGACPGEGRVTITHTDPRFWYVPESFNYTCPLGDLVRIGFAPDRAGVFTDTVTVASAHSSVTTTIVGHGVPDEPAEQWLASLGPGSDAYRMVYDPARGRLYIGSVAQNRVLVFSLAERAVVGSIAVGQLPIGLALSADGRWLYTANSEESTISEVDTALGREVRRITLPPLGPYPDYLPYSLVLAGSDRLLIGSVPPGLATGSPIYELNLRTLTLVARPDLGGGSNPALTLSLDRSTIGIVDEPGSSPGWVYRYDVAADTAIRTQLDIEGIMALNPDASRALVSSQGCNIQIPELTLLDRHLTLLGRIQLVGCAHALLAFNPVRPHLAYSADAWDSDALAEVDTNRRQQVARIVFERPDQHSLPSGSLIIAADGNWAYSLLKPRDGGLPSQLLAVYIGPAGRPRPTHTPTATATRPPTATSTRTPTPTPTYSNLTLHVNSTTDATDARPGDGVCATATGVCTLRAAVQEANAKYGPDTIMLPAGTYTLTRAGNDAVAATGDLDVTGPLTVVGAGATATVVDANGSATLDRAFQVFSGANLTASGLTIRNGYAWGAGAGGYEGGAIWGSGARNGDGADIHLSDCVLEHNRAAIGGAISTNEPLVVHNCIVRHNSADLVGGGLYSRKALTLTHSLVTDNTGGAGGGVFVDYNAPALISHSTLARNHAVRADSGSGGGVYSFASWLTLVNSTLSDNAAIRDGGGFYAHPGSYPPEIHLNNNTITGNTADADANGTGDGGGIFLADPPDIYYPTRTYVRNTLMAGNRDRSAHPRYHDCHGLLVTQGHNLVGVGSGCAAFAHGANGDLVGTATNPIAPLLGPLGPNGGPTLTHALQPGSPALEAGNPNAPDASSGACAATDQRGMIRPAGRACDIGAYEAATAPATPTRTPTPTVTRSATPSPSATRTPSATSTATPTGTATTTATMATAAATTTRAPDSGSAWRVFVPIFDR